MRLEILNPKRDPTWSVRIFWAGCPNKSGCQTWGGFPTEGEARAAATLLQAAIERGDVRFLDAMRKRSVDRIGDLLADYAAAGCPDRSGRPRAPGAVLERQRHIAGPLQWLADHSAARLTDRERDQYLAHRQATVVRGTGERTTELEIGTLNDALHWAWRRGDLKELPRAMRSTFRNAAAIRHARDCMPASAAELHQLAAWQFQNDAPVYGWLTLWKALSGLRDEECQLLQANPRRTGLEYPPGYVDAPAGCLRIARVKKGRNPRLQLNDPQRPHLAPLLQMILHWRTGQPGAGEAGTVLFPGAHAHTKSLQRAAKALELPPRTGHALRAYYATVRLAQGNPPETVARELGQGSGDELVRDVYGADPDTFEQIHYTSLADRFSWIPASADPATPAPEPAWTWWTQQQPNIIAL